MCDLAPGRQARLPPEGVGTSTSGFRRGARGRRNFYLGLARGLWRASELLSRASADIHGGAGAFNPRMFLPRGRRNFDLESGRRVEGVGTSTSDRCGGAGAFNPELFPKGVGTSTSGFV